jgi:hypothetical protein
MEGKSEKLLNESRLLERAENEPFGEPLKWWPERAVFVCIDLQQIFEFCLMKESPILIPVEQPDLLRWSLSWLRKDRRKGCKAVRKGKKNGYFKPMWNRQKRENTQEIVVNLRGQQRTNKSAEQ